LTLERKTMAYLNKARNEAAFLSPSMRASATFQTRQHQTIALRPKLLSIGSLEAILLQRGQLPCRGCLVVGRSCSGRSYLCAIDWAAACRLSSYLWHSQSLVSLITPLRVCSSGCRYLRVQSKRRVYCLGCCWSANDLMDDARCLGILPDRAPSFFHLPHLPLKTATLL